MFKRCYFIRATIELDSGATFTHWGAFCYKSWLANGRKALDAGVNALVVDFERQGDAIGIDNITVEAFNRA